MVDPLIAVSSDGNVTLRVEQQPLEWVLEEIAKQSRWSDIKERATATTSTSSGTATAQTEKARRTAGAPVAKP